MKTERLCQFIKLSRSILQEGNRPFLIEVKVEDSRRNETYLLKSPYIIYKGVLILKYIWIGLALSLLGVTTSLIIWGLDKLYYIPAGISSMLIGLCAIFSGSLLYGDRMRANYATETTEDRLNRDRFTTKCFFLAIPNIIVTALFYYLSYKGII